MSTIVTKPDGTSMTLADTRSPTEIAASNKAFSVRDLDETDITVIRCAEAGVAVPDDWKAYRAALRGIASTGTVPDAGWPARPDYPAGT